MQAVPSLEKPVPTPQHRLDYGTLSPTFISALKQWKTQTISFMDLPGELRNHIYGLHISGQDGYYTELPDLDPRKPYPLPLVALMFTCSGMQREILPLYFRMINLRLRYNRTKHSQGLGKPIDQWKATAQMIKLYARPDLSITDHLRSLRLESVIIDCNIKIAGMKAVHVELFAYGNWISSSALTSMSITIRNKIANSLVDSPTGFLGIRHLSNAHEEIYQVREWYEWKKQEQKWAYEKDKEALRGISCYCCCCEGDEGYDDYEDYLLKQAEEESMPRLIPATTLPRDVAEM